MRIAQAIGFDAPGLPSSVRESSNYEHIIQRAVNFIPRSSVVGTVHRHSRAVDCFIRSKGILFSQHYPYNWLTDGDDFVYADQSVAGKTLSSGLHLVINGISDARKGKIIDKAFDLLERSGKATFNELFK